MAADKKVKFVLDLDVKEFTEKGLHAKGVIESLSEKKNLEGLIEGLAGTTAVLGTVAAAAWTFKQAIDLTIEAEQIRRVQNQFENLTETVGISSKELKDGMEKAAQGLVTTGDLLEIANKAIVKMGASAKKLPEIMELARKSTAVYGGELKSNFESISEALANGNTRMLKQHGIVIDSEKAVKAFAKANNMMTNELSEAGRKQALLNAALEQGKKAFSSVQDDLNSTTNTVTLLKNTIAETKEVFVLAFEKTMGPSVRKALGGIKEVAEDTRQSLTAMFGEGLEKNQAAIGQLEKSITSIKNEIKEVDKAVEGDGFFAKLFKVGQEEKLAELNQELAETTQKLEALRGENSKLAAEEAERQAGKKLTGEDPEQDLIKKEVRLANEAKFQAQLQALKKASFDFEIENVQNLEQLDQLTKQRKVFAEEDYQEKTKQIINSDTLSTLQKTKLLEADGIRFHNQMQLLEKQTDDVRKKMLDGYVKNSKNAFDGIAKAFQAGSLKNKDELMDFGRLGNETFKSLQTHSSFAFAKMGEDMVKGKNIAQSAADAMAGFFLNMIADRAIGEGSLLLLSSLWPPNPLGLAAGAGLIALGGGLRTLAGGSGSSIAGASGGGAGMTGPGYGVSTQEQSGNTESSQSLAIAPLSGGSVDPEMNQMERKQRSVNVQIAGNYFDTEASRRQLMEMIRAETDATDFRYDRIGVG